MVMTRPSGGFRHLFVVGALALMAASGCSNSDRPTSSASSTTEPQTSDMPTAGVKQFCTEFAEVLSSEDPDFDRLKASARKEVTPEVDSVVSFSTAAEVADEAPDEAVIAEFQRSVVGMTVYAASECDDIEAVVADLGLDANDLKVLRKYTLADVRNDDTWPTIEKAISAG